MITPTDFSELRYGMFVHYGLFSMLARGEWTMNREQISHKEMRDLSKKFNPEAFDADAICRLAVEGGMKYLVFTTMHHEGFRMYETAMTDFNAKAVCGRDLVAEICAAARKHGLKLGLYHSLNNWFDSPDAVDAQENPGKYEIFIDHTFARLRELCEKFKPFDVMWYDGWWPFNADSWRALKMNDMLRKIQPGLLFNGRNCLPGDFGTPENHITPPSPWRPWEACMTLNNHWGFHAHDQEWKTPQEVVRMLLKCAEGKGNLLLNIGPRGDGAVPEKSAEIVRTVGSWIRNGGAELLKGLDPLPLTPGIRAPGPCGDWDHAGILSASGNRLYETLFYFPGPKLTLSGLECPVRSVRSAGFGNLDFEQKDGKIVVTLPPEMEKAFAPVITFECAGKPSVYRTGGMRVPKVEHPRYDPVMPDIQY